MKNINQNQKNQKKKIIEEKNEWMNLRNTPGVSKTKKVNLFLDIYSNIQLYKKKY